MGKSGGGKPGIVIGSENGGVRPSLRVLGILLAALPFVIAPGGSWLNPLDDLRWPLGAAGMLACIALVLLEQKAQPGGAPNEPPGGADFRGGLLFIAEPFRTGGVFICAGLILSAALSPAPGLGLLTALRQIFYVLFALCLALRRPRPTELRWVLGCLLAAMAAQALLALAQCHLPGWSADLLPIAYKTPTGRAAMLGTLGNPEYVAGWLAGGLAAAAVLVFGRGAPGRRGPDALALLAGVTGALSVVAIFISGGRGGAVAAVAVVLAGVVGRRIGERQSDGAANRQWRAWLAAGVVLLVLALAALWGAEDVWLRRAALPARLRELADLHSTSMRHRVGLLAVTSRMIADRPLTGAGPGRYGAAFGETLERLAEHERGIGFWSLGDALTGNYVGEAHCDPLQWWAEYGLLPLLGLTLMILRALEAGRRDLRRESVATRTPTLAIWAALATYAIGMWVSFPLQNPVRALTFWALLGLTAGLGQEGRDGPGNR